MAPGARLTPPQSCRHLHLQPNRLAENQGVLGVQSQVQAQGAAQQASAAKACRCTETTARLAVAPGVATVIKMLG